jgi:methionine aminopeptidase
MGFAEILELAFSLLAEVPTAVADVKNIINQAHTSKLAAASTALKDASQIAAPLLKASPTNTATAQAVKAVAGEAISEIGAAAQEQIPVQQG